MEELKFENNKTNPEQILSACKKLSEINKEFIIKEGLFRGLFPVAEKLMEAMEDLYNLKSNELLLADINKKVAMIKDPEDIEHEIKISDFLDRTQKRLESTVRKIPIIRQSFQEYNENYEVKKSAGTLAEEDKNIRTIFEELKKLSKYYVDNLSNTAITFQEE